MRGLCLAICVLAACGSHSGDDSDYMSIEVEPAFTTVTVPLGGTATQDYKVYGVNGSEKTDITLKCALSMDADFGTFVDATATVLPHGGKTTITAICNTLTGTALLGVNLVGDVVVPPAPTDAPDLFGNATVGTDAARVPVIEYPLEGAVSPRNMPPIEAQWTAAGNDLFHISLTSSFVAVNIYTTSPEAQLSEQDWENVMASSAGETLTYTVEGLAQATPDMKFTSTPRTNVIARDIIDKTAIYYWASSRGNIMEQTFGQTTQNLVKDGCTSCHTVNRSGTRIGYSRCVANDCGNLYTGFLKYDGASQSWMETVNANNLGIHGSYTTFPPNGTGPFTEQSTAAIVSMVNGTLQLYDPDTGMVVPSNLNQVSTMGPTSGRSALMADWSPDGNKIVFASTPNPNQWIDLSGSSIAMMSYAYTGGQHTFGVPTFPFPNPITLQNGSYTNFFFPSFSPDNALIVLNASRTSWRSNPARDAGQRLMLADAGGAWIVDMTEMNGGFADLDTTWAHWAPTVGTDYYWIVFSTERDYGHRLTSANTDPSCVANGVTQCKQIWIGAVAKNKLSGTVDPSAAPMWLPGQDMKADNISPYWSVPAGLF
ncbi:MAG TPA: hypothetical protein VFV99_25370 [Kofleriaceae bacterium]|nr:hypothetical protein [Kofleriaceae bacterium]